MIQSKTFNNSDELFVWTCSRSYPFYKVISVNGGSASMSIKTMQYPLTIEYEEDDSTNNNNTTVDKSPVVDFLYKFDDAEIDLRAITIIAPLTIQYEKDNNQPLVTSFNIHHTGGMLRFTCTPEEYNSLVNQWKTVKYVS